MKSAITLHPVGPAWSQSFPLASADGIRGSRCPGGQACLDCDKSCVTTSHFTESEHPARVFRLTRADLTRPDAFQDEQEVSRTSINPAALLLSVHSVHSLQTSKVPQIHLKPTWVGQVSSYTPLNVERADTSASAPNHGFSSASRLTKLQRRTQLTDTERAQNERQERQVVVGEWIYREWEPNNEEQVQSGAAFLFPPRAHQAGYKPLGKGGGGGGETEREMKNRRSTWTRKIWFNVVYDLRAQASVNTFCFNLLENIPVKLVRL